MPFGGWGRFAMYGALSLASIACSAARQSPHSGQIAGASGATAGASGGAAGRAIIEPGKPGCCPMSDVPSCCMAYGGYTYQQGICLLACDGMPAPDEGWTRGVDSHGCPIWVEPEKWTQCCGCDENERR